MFFGFSLSQNKSIRVTLDCRIAFYGISFENKWCSSQIKNVNVGCNE